MLVIVSSYENQLEKTHQKIALLYHFSFAQQYLSKLINEQLHIQTH